MIDLIEVLDWWDLMTDIERKVMIEKSKYAHFAEYYHVRDLPGNVIRKLHQEFNYATN